MSIYHKHHIVPKHAGGTDDPSNIIELTVEEHAEAHRILYEKYGRWQDKLAWEGLSGQIGKEEIIRKIQRKANLGVKRSEETCRNISLAKTGKSNGREGYVHTKETKKKIAEAVKGHTNWLGKNHTKDSKKRISLAIKEHWKKRKANV